MGTRGKISHKPAAGNTPKMPGWLSKEARAHWRRLVRVLADMGLVHDADQGALARLCSLYVDFERLQAVLSEQGHCREDGVRRAESRASAQISAEVLRLEEAFGLTPKGRARLEVRDKPSKASGKERFFARSAETPGLINGLRAFPGSNWSPGTEIVQCAAIVGFGY